MRIIDHLTVEFDENDAESPELVARTNCCGTLLELTSGADGRLRGSMHNIMLTYDPTTDQYTYIWRTDRSWRETCRMLVVRFNDGTGHLAKFRFK